MDMGNTRLQAFLGLVGYYQWFIKNFAQFTAPFYALLYGPGNPRTGVFKWGEEAERVFQKCKQLTSAPILAYADYSLPFVLKTDRSLKGLEAFQMQVQDDKEWVIA